MSMREMSATNRVYRVGAPTIVHAETLNHACEIAEGYVKGGVPVMGMNYALNNAGDIIQGFSEKCGDTLYVGAGTVLGTGTARHTILHGAASIIAPNYSEEAAKVYNRCQIPYAPGCTTITECVNALSSGATFVKAFPVSDFYGPRLVKVFKTPIPDMPILTSGGINLDNLTIQLENGVDVCGFEGLLTEGNSRDIAANAARIHEIITSFRCSE